jgi:tetratricopeptide (TPR) repeat protein
LESLLYKSLLRQDAGQDGEPRFVMLEMLHEYARERLEESGEAACVRRQHADYFAALAERAAPALLGPEQVYWSLRLRDEQENLRTALAWSLGGGDAEMGLRLVGALCDFWYYGGHSAEGLMWIRRALESATEAPPAIRARALNVAGRLAWDQGDFEAGKAYNREALTLYQALGDEAGTAWALNWLSAHALASPDECKEGIRLCEEGLALFRELGDAAGTSDTLNLLGELARLDTDYERAASAYQEAADIHSEQGNRLREAVSRGNLSYVAYHQGDYEGAKAHILEAFALFPEVHDTYYRTHGLSTLAGPVAALGNPQKAARLLGASDALLEKMGLGLQAGDRFEIERYVAAVKEQLDDATFEATWAEGRAMSFEEAVAYALSEDVD